MDKPTGPHSGKYSILKQLHLGVESSFIDKISFTSRLSDLTPHCSSVNTGSNSPSDTIHFGPSKPKPLRRVGIDSSFRDAFPDRHSLLHAPEYELPSIPICPDNYLKSLQSLDRPKIAQCFLDLFPTEAKIYSVVRNFNKPNYLGARLNLNRFPIDKWKSKLYDYEDQQLIQFLDFGWPVGDNLPTLGLPNHPSSTNYGEHIITYVNKECSFGALKGPFDSHPFEWLRLNPLMTRPKKDSTNRRVILDLSFPLGNSVNSEIDKCIFEGAPYKLRLPNALTLAEHIVKRGKNCLMFKIDLARAYRQLPSDPWDWALLGISWDDKLYFDTAIPFGVRHGAMACERTTKALCHIQTKDDQSDAEAYIDDIASVCSDNLILANQQFTDFLNTIDELGLQVSLEKCTGPSVILTWIGVTFDSVRMIMYIDKDKVAETLAFCESVLSNRDISKSTLRSVLGKLNHASKLSPPARRFLNRLLSLLRLMGNRSTIAMSKGASDDIKWFLEFLAVYNCSALIRSFKTEEATIEVDACLVGGRGFSPGLGYFFYGFPEDLASLKLHNSALESFNVLVGLRVFKDRLEGKTVRLFCDNEATVFALNSGKTRDKFMAFVLRQVWFLCATNDINLLVSHKPGAELITADLLSRGMKSHKDWLRLCEFRSSTSENWIPILPEHLQVPSDVEQDNWLQDETNMAPFEVALFLNFGTTNI